MPTSCGVSASETRWVAQSYSETHWYGESAEEQWIGSYGGLVAAGDSLFLYDQLRPRVVHLSGDLEERQAFGRQGEGPGEFNHALSIPWVGDVAEGHVAFDGRRVVIYDRHDIASFDASGEFRWSVRVGRFGLSSTGVRFVSPLDDETIVFGVDSLDARSRRLQLWRVRRPDPDYRELLWERFVSTNAREEGRSGRVNLGKREARSYWARHRGCVVVSDGGGQFLWLIDLSTLQTDSIALPLWEVPEFGELRSDFRVTNIRGRDVGARPQEPALLWRWRGLIVDPDGHAWLRAWTQSREEFQVFVVSLASGEFRHLINPPGFPTAFGPEGVFYTAREKSLLGEQYIVRLEGERR